MASRLYGIYKYNLIAAGGIDWDADTIQATLASGGDAIGEYTPDDQNHDFHSDLVGPYGNSGGSAYNSGTTLANKTNTVTDSGGGVWVARVDNTADTTLSSVPAFTGSTNNTCEHVIVYESLSDSASSGLICHMDITPVTPNGGDILIQWHANGLFDI